MIDFAILVCAEFAVLCSGISAIRYFSFIEDCQEEKKRDKIAEFDEKDDN